MPLGKRREKVLFGLGAKRGRMHRYTVLRWVVGSVFTAAIAALPFAGILRFDLWSGRHVLLGEEVGFVEAAKAFAFPFLAVNVLIIVGSRFVGRYLCGFVCPVGALARIGEWVRWSTRRGRAAVLRHAGLVALCAVLAAITFAFWIDWRVFVEGSVLAASISAALLIGLTAALYGGARWLGLRFCRDWCPSGVYFAVLGPKTFNGIEFAHPETCTDCHACETACPVDLQPREMVTAPPRAGTGLYPDGLSNYANCLRCGDCVIACEATTARSSSTPLRMGWLSADAPDSIEAPATAPQIGKGDA